MFSVTNFSFSKQRTFCGERDFQISFSKSWTLVHSFISTTSFVVVNWWVSFKYYYCFDDTSYLLANIIILYTPPVVCHIIGIIFTALFVFFDQICCYCCECWRGEQELVVYDPDNPSAALVISNGAVVDINQRYETEETEESEV